MIGPKGTLSDYDDDNGDDDDDDDDDDDYDDDCFRLSIHFENDTAGTTGMMMMMMMMMIVSDLVNILKMIGPKGIPSDDDDDNDNCFRLSKHFENDWSKRDPQ